MGPQSFLISRPDPRVIRATIAAEGKTASLGGKVSLLRVRRRIEEEHGSEALRGFSQRLSRERTAACDVRGTLQNLLLPITQAAVRSLLDVFIGTALAGNTRTEAPLRGSDRAYRSTT
jgi:hypothetical protein